MADICLSTKSWRSGSGWFAQLLAESMAEASAGVAFIAPLADPMAREPRHPGIERIVIGRERVEGGPRWARLWASLRRVAGGALAVARVRLRTRIFVFSIPEPLVFSLPLFAVLRLSGAKVVLVVHDAQPHDWRLPHWLRWLERGALWMAYALASHLVCLAEAGRAVLVDRFGIAGERISVIPHGAFATAPLAAPIERGRLLAFGSIRRNKRLVEVIEGVIAARRAGEDVRLVIAGEPAEPRYWEKCQVAMAEDPEGFEVHAGFFPESDVPALLASCEALVLAYEDFDSQSGVGVLAGMAGRPVIATRSGGLDELFNRGLRGEIIAGAVDAGSVSEAIARFRARPLDDWHREAAAGAEALAASLGWPAIGRAYVDLARQLEGSEPLLRAARQ